jgi:hypothetical protein
MSGTDEIMAQLPIAQIAQQLGVDEQTAEAAARQALPALLLGMDANAKDPAGAASLEQAIGQHDPGLIEGGVNLGDVDTTDGEKIVGHVFGDNSDQVMHALGGSSGVGGNVMAKLVPILAPIVLSYLAKQLGGSGGSGGSGGGLGGLLGQVLAGAGHGGGQGGGLGDLLGGLLGGGRR